MIQQEVGRQAVTFFLNRGSVRTELLCAEFKATVEGLSWDLLLRVRLNFQSLQQCYLWNFLNS